MEYCGENIKDVYHEIILQIGNRDHMRAKTEDGQLAAKIFDEYMRDFRQRNSTLRVVSAYLHMDGVIPHLHIDFIPYTTGSKRGLETGVSLKRALTEDKEKLLFETEKLEKQQKKLQQEIHKIVQSKEVMERNIHAYEEDTIWQLAEPGALISAKAYRDKKVLLLLEKLKRW